MTKKALTLKEKKKIHARRARVIRTTHQLAITAFLAIYPLLVQVSDLGALQAILPTVGFVAFGAVVTDIYNRVKPAS